MRLLNRRSALATAGILVLALPILADEKPKAVVEFRRAETAAADGLTEALVAGTTNKVYLHKAADLTADDIASAKLGDDAKSTAIEITFTEAGAKKAAKLSEAHDGKPVAIVVDGKVLAAPVIRAKFGGSILITGQFTAEEAKALAKTVGGK